MGDFRRFNLREPIRICSGSFDIYYSAGIYVIVSGGSKYYELYARYSGET